MRSVDEYCTPRLAVIPRGWPPSPATDGGRRMSTHPPAPGRRSTCQCSTGHPARQLDLLDHGGHAAQTRAVAAAAARPRQPSRRDAIELYVAGCGPYGATRDEIAEALGMPIQSCLRARAGAAVRRAAARDRPDPAHAVRPAGRRAGFADGGERDMSEAPPCPSIRATAYPRMLASRTLFVCPDGPRLLTAIGTARGMLSVIVTKRRSSDAAAGHRTVSGRISP